MRNIWIIARRDVRAQFNSPVAYVVIGGTMLLLGVLFFLIPHVGGGFLQGSFWEIDQASMLPLFTYLPLLMSLFVVPAITMRSLAAERGSGTLELLITMPVRDSEVMLGKYLASCLIVSILLAATLLYPIALFAWPWHLGPLDWGPVWSGYLGCLFFSFAAIAVGLMISSLTESDVIAFFVTACVLFGLYAVGWMVALVPGAFGDIVGFFSFQTRYQSFPRGLIDTRAIVYFASVAIVCMLVGSRSLESRKWS
jgi:ABC-2 type transport system permease protein